MRFTVVLSRHDGPSAITGAELDETPQKGERIQLFDGRWARVDYIAVGGNGEDVIGATPESDEVAPD